MEVRVARHGALYLDGALLGVPADPDTVAGEEDPAGRALALAELGASLVAAGAVGVAGARVANIAP